ncbi:MAG: hypothetical protein GXO70_00410 [Acidobacteria bacterium]|nr:hypothetical protein [Acidobacteriota bacterium]
MSLTDFPGLSLALGSGAARGLAHIGVLNTLDKAGVKIDAISGCSIGAVIGGFYAAGKLAEAEEYYRNMDRGDVIRNFDPIFPSGGLINGRKIIHSFREIVGDIRLGETNIPFYPVATELTTGETEVLADCRLWEAIRASISIPGLFKPYRLKKKWYVDGGLTNPVPVDVLKSRHGSSQIVAVNLNLPPSAYHRSWIKPLGAEADDKVFLDRFPAMKAFLEKKGIALLPKEEKPGMLYTLNRTFHIFQYEIAWRSIEMTKPDYVITPILPDLLFYDFHKADQAISEGKHAAENFLSEWRKQNPGHSTPK